MASMTFGAFPGCSRVKPPEIGVMYRTTPGRAVNSLSSTSTVAELTLARNLLAL